ncbi:hypothetical protein QEN19_003027 [Hanseniaspora menglaensis]
MVVVKNIERASTFAWSNSKQPKLALGSISGKIDANFSNDSKLEIWDCFQNQNAPSTTINASSKFLDLAWSKNDATIVGALDNGVVEFYSVLKDNEELAITATIKAHNSSVQALAFSSVNETQLATGDASGLINIWDINNISNDYKPTSAGSSITAVDNIKSLAWNNRIGHILASAGSSSGFTSIWDLNQRKEILHIGYTNPETSQKVPLDVVQWHPHSGTVIATASNSDLNTAVILWDLRKSNIPLEILKDGGHSKGVLSLDWCSKDSGLLMSSSADNTVCLWDPETTKSLLQVYPPRSNWVFKAKFAPELPDYFATASHDSLIEIQQLQDFQIDSKVAEIFLKDDNAEVEADEPVAEQNDDDFWNSLSQNNASSSASKKSLKVGKSLRKANQSKNIAMHVPKWVSEAKTINPAASWAFGGKMVKISKDGKSVSVFTQPKNTVSSGDLQKQYDLLQSALNKKDFNAIISKRVNSAINENNEDDWSLLDKISLDGKETFFKEALALDAAELEEEEKDKEEIEGEEFFEKLEQESLDVTKNSTNYEFSNDVIFRNLVNKDFKKAADLKLENENILEALIIAHVSGDANLKEKVVKEYFVKNASKSSSSRLLFTLSEGKIEDLIQKTDVSNWKFVAKSIKNYVANEEEQTKLYTILGDKLYSSGNRQDALVLFMSSGILDKVGDIWVEELKDIEEKLKSSKNSAYEAHMESLTEFVERFSCFVNFFEANNNLINGNSKIVSIILEFVNTICINGNFNLALDFLNILPSDNADVATEKQRVLIASGKDIVTNKVAKQSRYGRQTNVSVSSVPVTTASSLGQPAMKLQSNSQIVGSAAATPKAVSPIPVTPRQASYAPSFTSGGGSIYATIPQPKSGHAKAATYAPSAVKAPSVSSIPAAFNGTAPPAIVPVVNNPYKPKASIVTAPVATTPHSFKQQTPEPTTVQSIIPPLAQNRGVIQPQIISSPVKTEQIDSPNKAPVGIVSGQKPSGNKHANAGWNDFALPIPDTAVRAKAIGVKKEAAVATPAIISPFQSSQNNQLNNLQVPSKSVLPPPPIASRTTSSKNVTEAVPKKRNVSEKSTRYAPSVPASPVVASLPSPTVNGSAVPIQPQIQESKPSIAPPVFNNPYAPPKQSVPPTLNKFAPPQPPKASNGISASSSPAILPPPIKRKATNTVANSPPVSVLEVTTKDDTKAPPAESTLLVAEENEHIQEEQIEEKEEVFTVEEAERIKNYFNERMPLVTENLSEKFAAQIKDTQKRITILGNHLKKKDLITSRDVIIKLLSIIDALTENNFAEAKNLQSGIASEYPEEAGKWLTGVKRFIGFAEVYESKK